MQESALRILFPFLGSRQVPEAASAKPRSRSRFSNPARHPNKSPSDQSLRKITASSLPCFAAQAVITKRRSILLTCTTTHGSLCVAQRFLGLEVGRPQPSTAHVLHSRAIGVSPNRGGGVASVVDIRTNPCLNCSFCQAFDPLLLLLVITDQTRRVSNVNGRWRPKHSHCHPARTTYCSRATTACVAPPHTPIDPQ